MSQSTLPSALKTYSVLPDNRSALERALELSLTQQMYAVDHPYPQLLDAWHTSIDVVPYLAAERQLPVWDTADSEHVKRSLAGNAWQIRQLSGTRAGLNMALESFDFLSEIKPWYQQTPQGQPYSLEVIAWEKGNKPVNVANVKKLQAYIADTQSERDKIELSLMFGVETSLRLTGSGAPSTNIKNTHGEAGLWPMPSAKVFLSVAAAVPPAINIHPLNLQAAVPIITGYGQVGMTAVAAHYSVTASSVSAIAVL
ncbi:phage tail protein I [Shewanella sp. VB17]|uniref:phage tail protein I n=1 Tax=Shewanella sp. VB17 TaxID=2739432 RepID=UPI00156643B6|nr:phage tail protein I [Shewanella sp. VB17]NRD72691.1 phage tail protein I [Shewanella sp. VB17]